MKGICKKNQVMITALAIMVGVAGYLHFAQGKISKEELTAAQANSDQVLNSGIVVENYKAGEVEDLSLDEIGMLDISSEDLEAAGVTDIESLDSDPDLVTQDYLENGMLTDSSEQLEAAGVTEGNEDTLASVDVVQENVQENVKEDLGQGEIPGQAVFTSTTTVSSLAGAKLSKEQTRARNKETLLEIINNEALSETQKQSAVDTMVAMTQIAEMETAAELLLEAKGFEDVVVSITGDTVDVVVANVELTGAKCAQIEDIVQRKTGVAPENIIISTN